MKKEIEKINQQIKDNIKAVETKISNQEKSLDGKLMKNDTELKNSIKDLTSKLNTAKPGKFLFNL